MSRYYNSIPEVPKYTCKRCEVEKLLIEYARQKNPAGHSYICKECCKKAQTNKNKVKGDLKSYVCFGRLTN